MIETHMAHYIQRHEHYLQTIIQQTPIPAKAINDAMQYALFSGGKRIRPLLVYLCGEVLDVQLACLDVIAASVELIHTYSLIHDDLPAMDNDDYRRGKPSCHRAFDEATAILVGDGMQALATELLLTELPKLLSSEHVISITRILARASGPAGMVSGQSLDLSELIQQTITEADLLSIHSLKTGQLISACFEMVIAASQLKGAFPTALIQFAANLGLAFQIQDDYLDAYETSHGKNRASDLANQKLTFAKLYNQSTLLDFMWSYFNKAKASLKPFENKAQHLLSFITYLESRAV